MTDYTETPSDAVAVAETLTRKTSLLLLEGYGMRFQNGKDARVTVNQPIANFANFSIAYWMRADDFGEEVSGTNNAAAMNFYENADNGVYIGYHSNEIDEAWFQCNPENGGDFGNGAATAYMLSDSNTGWNHYAMTYNGTTVRLYYNGVEQNTNGVSVTRASTNVIGCKDDAGTGSWSGALDDVRVYDTILTLAEIKELYNDGSGTNAGRMADLAGWWQFNEGKTCPTAFDTSGNANDGTVTGTTVIPIRQAGKVGNAISGILAKETAKNLTVESLAIVEAVSMLRGRVMSESISLNETRTNSIPKAFSEVVSLVDVLNLETAMTLTEALAVSEEVYKAFKTLFEEAISMVESQEHTQGRQVQDTLAIAGALDKVIGKNISDPLAFSEIITRAITTSVDDELTLAEILSKKKFVTFVDALSFDESVASELKEFLSDMQSDFETILSDVPFSEQAEWGRSTQVEDEFGRVSSSTSWVKTIPLIIQPITEKDRDILAVGIQVSGHMKAYCKKSYRINDDVGFAEIKTGDTIIRNDLSEYMVEKIVGKYGGMDVEVYRKLILREISNG